MNNEYGNLWTNVTLVTLLNSGYRETLKKHCVTKTGDTTHSQFS